MQFKMTGKITKVNQIKNQMKHVIITPAPDAYTQPSSFVVLSPNTLGGVGQEVTLDCSLRGFVRNKSYTDKKTGELIQFDDSNVFIDAVLAQPQQQENTPVTSARGK